MQTTRLLNNLDQKLPWIIVVLMLMLSAINIVQFHSTAEDQPDNYNSLHSYATDDFEREFTEDFPGGEVTFRMYTELAKAAPNLALIIDSELQPANTRRDSAFDEFYDRLLGSAQAESIEYSAVDESEVLGDLDVNSAPILLSGENWRLSSRQAKGDPPLMWTLVADKDLTTNDFLLIKTGEKEIMFIDLALLDEQTLDRVEL